MYSVGRGVLVDDLVMHAAFPGLALERDEAPSGLMAGIVWHPLPLPGAWE